MKKSIALVLALAVMTSGLFAAKKEKKSKKTSAFKVGVIYIGDENEGYTEAHMKGIAEMKKALGLSDSQVIEKKGIPESEKAYDAAVDLAEQGCTYIIATSFGHESYLIQAAKEYPKSYLHMQQVIRLLCLDLKICTILCLQSTRLAMFLVLLLVLN